MPTADFLRAALPLFESGVIEAVEWSFDIGWDGYQIEDWTLELLDEFARNDALIGHGVTFSLLSARTDAHHMRWLERLRDECSVRKYQHISEHFGFMRAGQFLDNTVLPASMSDELLKIAVQRLQDIRDAVQQVPVGLENLALAFSDYQVDEQPRFLEKLLAPIDGFLLLDLHNIFCQSVNFQRDPIQLMRQYPLDRVRQIHIAGGSEVDGLRVDTHDGDVPLPVFEMLSVAIAECPNLEYVVLERMADTLKDERDEEQLRLDYGEMRKIVDTVRVHA